MQRFVHIQRMASNLIAKNLHSDEIAGSPGGLNGDRPLALAFLLRFGVGTLRKRTKALRNLLCIVVLLAGGAVAAMLSGCGGGINGYFAQGPQTYTITLTATAGGLNHSGNVTLTVQ
jgi:hypothetical protein